MNSIYTSFANSFRIFQKYVSIVASNFRIENTGERKQKEKRQIYRKWQMQYISSIMHLPFSEDKG